MVLLSYLGCVKGYIHAIYHSDKLSTTWIHYSLIILSWILFSYIFVALVILHALHHQTLLLTLFNSGSPSSYTVTMTGVATRIFSLTSSSSVSRSDDLILWVPANTENYHSVAPDQSTSWIGIHTFLMITDYYWRLLSFKCTYVYNTASRNYTSVILQLSDLFVLNFH